MSYISTLRTQYKRNRELILAMLEISPAAHAWHRYETGLEYLETILLNDEDAKRILSGSKDFWAWWNNQWNQMDKKWRAQVIDRDSDLSKPISSGRTATGAAIPLISEYYALHNVERHMVYPCTSLIRNIFNRAKHG